MGWRRTAVPCKMAAVRGEQGTSSLKRPVFTLVDKWDSWFTQGWEELLTATHLPSAGASQTGTAVPASTRHERLSNTDQRNHFYFRLIWTKERTGWEERCFEGSALLLHKLLISILQRSDFFKKNFQHYLKASLANPFAREKIVGVGGICGVLRFSD